MFRWLTRVLTGKKKKETEIRKLKEEISSGVAECREKAKKGDSDASLRLNALRETITEQSVRLTGGRPSSTKIQPGGLK